LIGKTESNDFPITEDALLKEHDFNPKSFISVLNLDGSKLLYSSYLIKAPQFRDALYGLDFKSNGNPVIVGASKSFDETEGVFDYDLTDAEFGLYITELDEVNYLPLKSCFIGIDLGNVYENAVFKIDNDDNLHFGLATRTSNFPISSGAINKGGLETDGLYFVLDENIRSLKYSSYFGALGILIRSLDVYSDGYASFCGLGFNLPVTDNAYKRYSDGDNFIIVFNYKQTGIEEDKLEVPILIYPNPAAEYLYLAGAQDINYYKIYDIFGAVKLTGISADNRINVSSLPVGTYFLSSGSHTQKFTVTR
jgi:hypothetical protein